MKKIDKNELYQHLRSFLKSKGVALEDGSYSKRLQQGCTLLSEAINTTQTGVERARVKVNSTVDNLRQSIHKATAPRPDSPESPKTSASAATPTAGPSPKSAPRKSAPKKPRRKPSSS